MELISLYYFSELAKDLHMTRTAERLYISQQTLSNHIARMEAHYGTKLLYRKPSLALTPAGEQVLAFAKSILRAESSLNDVLSDMERQERGVLRFGGSTLRLNSALPHVLAAFSNRYPKVEIRLTDTISSQLTDLILNGQLDLAVTVSGRQSPLLAEEHLMDDQVYLCAADSLLYRYYGEESEALKRKSANGASIGDFAKLPFCLLENRVGELVYECFAEAKVTPWPYIKSTYTQISTTVCYQGLAAAFVPQVCLVEQRRFLPDDINIFTLLLRGKPLVQHVNLIRLKDRYLPRPFLFFQNLLSDYYRDVQRTDLARIV